jgi:hypothetical protein
MDSIEKKRQEESNWLISRVKISREQRRGLGMNPRGVGVNAASCAVSHAEATIMAECETALLHLPLPAPIYLSSEDRIPY